MNLTALLKLITNWRLPLTFKHRYLRVHLGVILKLPWQEEVLISASTYVQYVDGQVSIYVKFTEKCQCIGRY